MPSVYQLKPAFQRLLRPLVRALASAGVTANQVTLFAAALSALAGAAIGWYAGYPPVLLLLPVVLFVRMALNAIDGMLAREHGQMSKLGAILNELGDVIADAALYLPLALWPLAPVAAIVVLVLLATVSEMTGVIGVQIGASRRYDGPLGKSDRAFVFGALGLVFGLGAPGGVWVDWTFWILAALAALTIINRARAALAEVRP